MNNFEQKFWKAVTWFGELPGIFIPVSFVLIITISSISNSVAVSDGGLINLGGHYYNLMIASILSCLGIFVSYSIGTVIKYFYYKPRPIPRDTSTLWKRINAGSMPSIHSSNAFITAISLIFAFLSLLSNNNISKFIIIGGGVVYYVSIALSRIALQKHYPIDVLAGTVLGIIITCILTSSMNNIIHIVEKIISSFA